MKPNKWVSIQYIILLLDYKMIILTRRFNNRRFILLHLWKKNFE